jgi:hypothetical protein
MFIGIDCRVKHDENGEVWVRCAPVIREATKHQRTRAVAVITCITGFILLLMIGMVMTDVSAKDSPIIDVQPKYGVMP